MSAAAGFRFYYMNDATFKQIARQLGEKYHADGFFPLVYHPQIKKGELWAALLREYKYLYECHTGEPYEDLAELLKGKNYYIATTNQDAQFFRTFPAEKITRIQGDFRYWQCKHTCTDEIYPNKEKVYELLDKIEGDRLPDALIMAALIHYQVEMIHPFIDGNGRIGRLLTLLFLMDRNVIQQPVLSLSKKLMSSSFKYFTGIASVEVYGAYPKWVKYFLQQLH